MRSVDRAFCLLCREVYTFLSPHFLGPQRTAAQPSRASDHRCSSTTSCPGTFDPWAQPHSFGICQVKVPHFFGTSPRDNVPSTYNGRWTLPETEIVQHPNPHLPLTSQHFAFTRWGHAGSVVVSAMLMQAPLSSSISIIEVFYTCRCRQAG